MNTCRHGYAKTPVPIISLKAYYPNQLTITLAYVDCIQYQHLKSASSYKPSVVVPPELNESLRPQQAHDPISAITQHHTSSRHLIDLTLLDCDGGILMKQALDHYVPIDCMRFGYAVKLKW